MKISHASIHPNPDQPRKTFDAAELQDLANSIRESGLLQAILVRPVGDQYEIVAGERRWRAHGLLIAQGYAPANEVECIVRDMTLTDRDIAAIIENLNRVDVAPLEEARAFQRMIDGGMTIEDLAIKLGRPVWRIEERTRLMRLDPVIVKLCEGGFDHHVARELARLPSHRDQVALTQMWNRGAIIGFKALKAAVAAKLEGMTQSDMFGDAPKATAGDVLTVKGMEAKIERMAALSAAGWRDGECVVAAMVSRDRAALMADKIRAMRAALFAMEGELRAAAAQAEIVMDAGEAPLLAAAE